MEGREKTYLRHSVLPFEEDQTHEFKGHRSISKEEKNPWNFYQKEGLSKKFETRQNISKYLCGMLNSGKGGVIYAGVLDNGQVEGCMMTCYQKDHVRLSLRDTFDRFTPSVPPHMYSVDFVPVVDTFDSTVRSTPESPSVDREKDHVIRSFKYCWCDAECAARFLHGRLSQFYVIEFRIKPWEPSDKRNKELVKDPKHPWINPLFTAEDGCCYIRRNASNEKVEMEDVLEITKMQLEKNL